jgi:hypothetical protein
VVSVRPGRHYLFTPNSKQVKRWSFTGGERPVVCDSIGTSRSNSGESTVILTNAHIAILPAGHRISIDWLLSKWMAEAQTSDEVQKMFLRHLSIFADRGDKEGIYPRDIPGKEREWVFGTLNMFYGNNLLYNLTRQ